MSISTQPYSISSTILQYPDARLMQPSAAVEAGTDIEPLIAGLLKHVGSGAGLAAPQIGVPLRVFIRKLPECAELFEGDRRGSRGHYRVYANPEVVVASSNKQLRMEACLSLAVNGCAAKVVRARSVDVRFLDSKWRIQEETLSGSAAAVFQHEFDHLNGVLFIHRLTAGVSARILRNSYRGK